MLLSTLEKYRRIHILATDSLQLWNHADAEVEPKCDSEISETQDLLFKRRNLLKQIIGSASNPKKKQPKQSLLSNNIFKSRRGIHLNNLVAFYFTLQQMLLSVSNCIQVCPELFRKKKKKERNCAKAWERIDMTHGLNHGTLSNRLLIWSKFKTCLRSFWEDVRIWTFGI